MALTGDRINGVDMIAVGLATHYAMSEVSHHPLPRTHTHTKRKKE